jgi:hypothetical protein
MKSLALLVIFGCLLVPRAYAQAPQELAGTWLSPTVKFVISNTGHEWRVHGFDECRPQWCDWGEITLSLLAKAKVSKDYTHAFATWNVGPYIKNVLFKIEPAGLSAEVFTVYDPKVGRSNYLFATPLTKEK